MADDRSGLSEPDLAVTLGPLQLENPILTASGTFGYGEVCAPYMDTGRLGGIVCKTITPRPRIGNPPPRVAEIPGGMLNSIGLQNPGLEGFLSGIAPRLPGLGVPVVVSIAGDTVEEYRDLAARLDRVPGIAALELNISCPNVKKGGLEFGVDPESTERIVRLVKEACRLPAIAKLSPLVTDIGSLAVAAERGGADALCLINTVPGLVVDWRRRRPVLGAGFGGISGPAIKPIALRQIHAVRRAARLPIIGVGGIFTGVDVLEYMVTGASAVQVGTATYIDPAAPVRILDEVRAELGRAGVSAVRELIGTLTVGEMG